MLKKLTFGQYAHKDSITHKLDPRIKILAVILLSATAFLLETYYKFAIFSLFVFLLIMLSKINFSSLIRNLRPFFFIFAFILMMYILFSRNELDKGIQAIWKFVLLIIIASILTFTTTITNLVTGIEKLSAPLKLIKINSRTIALLIALTIRFVPALFLYAERIKDARLARLGSLKSPKHVKLLFLPLLDRIFKSASTLSDAMLARNYTEKRISYFSAIGLKNYDYISFTVLLAFIFLVLLM
ncbi:energy-coupling factor transporter transmembrane protein EcfT [Candidatus Woesearchaeota archaeon]|nr:energy-coupling factor transporter transmembrane protein EcfT [Candidatus Woesearchaeota archaeon]